MAKQLMIYDEIIPVSSKRHFDLSIDRLGNYGFADGIRAVPLVAEEIPRAALEYTVVFANMDTQGTVGPFAILGLNEGKNLYVESDGTWSAQYIPAFVRRYPFVFADTTPAADADDSKPKSKTFTLCIDEAWEGCNREGRGERLFDDEGGRTEFLDQLLKFNEKFQRSAEITRLYCKRLQDLALLDSKEARLNLGDRGEVRLPGFMVVNREKLNKLPGETLSELATGGALELTYAQIFSMSNLPKMAAKIAELTTGQGQEA